MLGEGKPVKVLSTEPDTEMVSRWQLSRELYGTNQSKGHKAGELEAQSVKAALQKHTVAGWLSLLPTIFCSHVACPGTLSFLYLLAPTSSCVPTPVALIPLDFVSSDSKVWKVLYLFYTKPQKFPANPWIGCPWDMHSSWFSQL